jgi:hypothetical protein
MIQKFHFYLLKTNHYQVMTIQQSPFYLPTAVTTPTAAARWSTGVQSAVTDASVAEWRGRCYCCGVFPWPWQLHVGVGVPQTHEAISSSQMGAC